jgi:hypothetical protein
LDAIYPIVYPDALVVELRTDGRVENRALYEIKDLHLLLAQFAEMTSSVSLGTFWNPLVLYLARQHTIFSVSPLQTDPKGNAWDHKPSQGNRDRGHRIDLTRLPDRPIRTVAAPQP